MKLNKITLLTTALLFSSTLYAQNGAELFEAKCSACHVTSRPSNVSTLVAPPVMGVMRHVKMNFSTKKEAVAFIGDYALNPTRSKALCKSQKIMHFGIMPSQKGNVSKKELEKIASWMYDNFPPKRIYQNSKKNHSCGSKKHNCKGN